jgi:hypothetical protein
MRRLGEQIVVALLIGGFPCFAQADALQRAGRAVHGNDDGDDRADDRRASHSESSSGGWRSDSRHDSRNDSHHGHHHHNDWSDDDEDAEATQAAARGLMQVLLFPWALPAAVVSEYNAEGYSVPIYPYADQLAYSVRDEPTSIDQRRIAQLRLRLGATARSPQLVSGTLATQLDFSLPLSLHLDYRVLTYADGGRRSYAGLGNAELLYRFAEARSVRFFTGLGYVQWADPAGLGHGFGAIYGFEAYPIQPISFGSRVSVGMLGASYAFQWRSHIGVLLSRYELQLAYDHVDVGGIQLGGLQLSFEAHL